MIIMKKNKSDSNNAKVVQGFYTMAEAAAIAKVSSLTIFRAIKAGKLKSLQPGGRNSTRLIPQGNLVAYLYGKK
jgi:excisionase family DNA binding protein